MRAEFPAETGQRLPGSRIPQVIFCRCWRRRNNHPTKRKGGARGEPGQLAPYFSCVIPQSPGFSRGFFALLLLVGYLEFRRLLLMNGSTKILITIRIERRCWKRSLFVTANHLLVF